MKVMAKHNLETFIRNFILAFRVTTRPKMIILVWSHFMLRTVKMNFKFYFRIGSNWLLKTFQRETCSFHWPHFILQNFDDLSSGPRSLIFFNAHTPDRFTPSHARCAKNWDQRWLFANSAKNFLSHLILSNKL